MKLPLPIVKAWRFIPFPSRLDLPLPLLRAGKIFIIQLTFKIYRPLNSSIRVSFPLVFHEATMTWFNHHFVTAELPPPEDMETWLEVGSASWGWMEPVLGQISFFLLCMQFARAQIQNLGIRPYYNWVSLCGVILQCRMIILNIT